MDDNQNNNTAAVNTTFMTVQQKNDVAEMKGFKNKEEMTDYFAAQLALIELPTVAAYNTRLTELKNIALEVGKYDLVDSTDIYQQTKDDLENRKDSDSKIVQDVLGVLGSIFASILPMLGMLSGNNLSGLAGMTMTDTNSIGSGNVSGSNHSQNNGMGV